MGFLKRLFSIKSKKNKNKSSNERQAALNSGLRPVQEDEQEAAVSRLLRSSSARFATDAELVYPSLPPLPHPINKVVQSSTNASLRSSNTQRSTYNVTVHGRKRHASTEFPNANCDLYEPKMHAYGVERQEEDTSQILKLRSDPSVASLLNMYDEHGQIPSKAFSNTSPSPTKEGRAQTRRNGSTLRQLLGNPPGPSANDRNPNCTAQEGDISWAERFLGESDSASSISSVGLRTPHDLDAHFIDTHSHNAQHDNTFSTDHDSSSHTSENPAISSMEVEVSINSETLSSISGASPNQRNNPYESSDLTTPQRASQVFGFLTEKRRSRYLENSDRELPVLPSAFSTPSDLDSPRQPDPCRSQFSSDSSSDSIPPPTSSLPVDENLPLDDVFVPSSNSSNCVSLSSQLGDFQSSSPSTSVHSGDDAKSNIYPKPSDLCTPTSEDSPQEIPKAHPVKIIMTVPTKVIVTAPTPQASNIDNLDTRYKVSTRIPRGPRTQTSRSNTTRLSSRPALGQRLNSNDPFTSVPSRPRRSHSNHRTSSVSSLTLMLSDSDAKNAEIETPATTRPAGNSARIKRVGSRPIITEFEKENRVGRSALSVKHQLPSTPMRSDSNTSQTFFRNSMFRPPVGMTPSPASSSELSPVGQKLMMDLRQQRMKAREVERQGKGRFGGRV